MPLAKKLVVQKPQILEGLGKGVEIEEVANSCGVSIKGIRRALVEWGLTRKARQRPYKSLILNEVMSQARLLQKDLALTNTDLGDRMEMSGPYVHRLLQGRHNISLSTLERLADSLDCELQITIAPRSADRSRRKELYARAKAYRQLRGLA